MAHNFAKLLLIYPLGGAILQSDWIEKQCPAAFKYSAPTCQNGGTLFVNRNEVEVKESSCSHCDCPNGWGGLRCNLCKSVDACSPKDVNGKIIPAISCTNNHLLPTLEEALGDGKPISCTCGGGRDDWSALLCAQQPDTRLEFVIKGAGNSSSTASIEMIEYAAILRKDEEKWEGQYDYWFPEVFNGTLSDCIISTGKCLDVPDSNVSNDDCFVFECGQTAVDCPPPQYEACLGFPECVASNGEKYKTHKCNAIPESNKSMVITCEQNATATGIFICYYQQPGGFAPLSIACSVGTCLYEGSTPIDPDNIHVTSFTLTIAEQSGIVGIIILLLVAMFFFLTWLSFEDSSFAQSKVAEVYDIASDDSNNYDEFSTPFLELNAILQMERIAETTIEWKDIYYFTCVHGTSKAILKNVCGRSGVRSELRVDSSLQNMVAVLGPSGSGKSSLLELLSGRKCKTNRYDSWSGFVRLDGHPASLDSMKHLSGYVSQSDDVLPEMLTVFEHLMFHAKFRLPNLSVTDRYRRVLCILVELKLDTVSDTLIGGKFKRGISDGEKRRLRIAVELLSQPRVLFVDEPTSGLDATNAMNVMTIMENLARLGTTVICSLHQPRKEVLDMIGIVIVLFDGEIAYSGLKSGVYDYFSFVGRPISVSTKNIGDALLDLCTKHGSELTKLYKQFLENPFLEAEFRSQVLGVSHQRNQGSSRTPSSEDVRLTSIEAFSFNHFFILSSRLIRQAQRHPLLLTLHCGGTIVLSFIVAFLYSGQLKYDLAGAQSRFGLLFFELMILSLLSLSSLPVWRESRRIFLSERDSFLNGRRIYYSPSTYFIAASMFDILVIRVLPPMFMTLIIYPIAGLNSHSGHGPRLLYSSIILILVDISTSLAVMAIGVTALPLPVGNLLGALLILIFILFSRFLLNASTLPLATRWLTYVTPMGYAFEASLINEFGEGSSGGAPYRIEGKHCAPDLPLLEPLGPEILRAFGFEDSIDVMYWNCIALVSLSIVYASVALILTFRVDREESLPYKTGSLIDQQLTESTQQSFASPDVRDKCNHSLELKSGPDVKKAITETVEVYEPGPIVSWSGLSYSILLNGKRKQILRNVSGYAGGRAGIVGLMGASGAGKSTLLEILAGRKEGTALKCEGGRKYGYVMVNGNSALPEHIRRISGYVPQQYVLPGMLTVYEHILFHAYLRLPSKTPGEEKCKRVIEISEELGLQKSLDKLIGDDYFRSLSGGEKRRVAIAAEMISCPNILFLDEPTTGLDASSALAMMRTLSHLSRTGTTVICSLHQPREEIFNMLGQVSLLKDGILTYFGPPSCSLSHFSICGHTLSVNSDNPADALLDTAYGIASIDEFPDPSATLLISEPSAAQWVNASAAELAAEAETNCGSTSWMYVTYLLLHRSFTIQWRDPKLLLLHILLPAVAGIAIGWSFRGLRDRNEETSGIQDRLLILYSIITYVMIAEEVAGVLSNSFIFRFGLFYVLLLFLALLGLVSVPKWVQSVHLHRQEKFSMLYRPSSHLLSLFVPDIIFCRFIPALILLITVFPIAGTRSGTNAFVVSIFSLAFFNAVMSVLLGIIASTSDGSVAAANAGGSLFIIFASLFGGLLVPIDQLGWSWSWVSLLNPFRWTFEAMVSNEFGGVPAIFRLSTKIGNKVATTELLSGNQILSCFGYNPQLLPLDMSMVFLMFLCGWIILFYVTRRQ